LSGSFLIDRHQYAGDSLVCQKNLADFKDTLQARETRVVRLSTRAQALSSAAVQLAVVTADGLRREAQASLEILGAPGTRRMALISTCLAAAEPVLVTLTI
jgi:hypothetical protein